MNSWINEMRRDADDASRELAEDFRRKTVWEKIKTILIFLGVVAVLVFFAWCCSEESSERHEAYVESISEDAIDKYVREFGNPEDARNEGYDDGYSDGCYETVREVLSLLEDHNIEDQALIDEIRMLAD